MIDEILIDKADEYFRSHTEADAWDETLYDERESLLNKAETMINSVFDLRKGTEELEIYQFAIFEQAIFLATFDKERSRLQREGVTSYKVEDLSFSMNQSVISPIAYTFLKKHIYKKVGKIL
ncbi:hypothetical protein [Bacillus sp. FJAT-50079]|uniref:hypothetical protein n=1 Tax=Bacillus sp. FJAT-50079 TaxID=2833577 RepID=UPI001BC943BB|nr:hypothetical protein [Bacillus sp. FJAT-50079]MBS4207449.1 hypothetical protein [Bacillus sp. FJAT-50079]